MTTAPAAGAPAAHAPAGSVSPGAALGAERGVQGVGAAAPSLAAGASSAGGATGVGGGSSPPPPRSVRPKARRSLRDRLEEFIARLTSRSNFWHRAASLIWLPYAFRSGIKIRQVDGKTFSAVLPFRRFNRNWYNAMAGASLLANAEIAGGMYIYGRVGGDYTCVCKHLGYRFLRPCYGPAIYRCSSKQTLEDLLRSGGEFNFEIEIEVLQQLPTRGLGREVRVGRCTATFHLTPKHLHERRSERRERAVEVARRAAERSSGTKGATAPADETAGPT